MSEAKQKVEKVYSDSRSENSSPKMHCFRFNILNFGFVSDFEFRASNFDYADWIPASAGMTEEFIIVYSSGFSSNSISIPGVSPVILITSLSTFFSSPLALLKWFTVVPRAFPSLP